MLMFEQYVMHLPELTLRSCRLCRLLGMGVDRGKREMTKHEAQMPAKQLLQLFDYVMSLAAIGALIVAILHHGHWCGNRSKDMVVLVNRHGQPWCSRWLNHRDTSCFVRSSRAVKMPSAPGFTPIGET
jgi:hypothetical protein